MRSGKSTSRKRIEGEKIPQALSTTRQEWWRLESRSLIFISREGQPYPIRAYPKPTETANESRGAIRNTHEKTGGDSIR